MEGGVSTTPICNPHICRVLFGTVRFFGVLWGAVGYWDLLGYVGIIYLGIKTTDL